MTRVGKRREEGAVAVVVSIVLTLVLIPVAAFALDLGTSYTLGSAVQRAADAAATAGAQELARQQRTGAGQAVAMDRARTVAIDVLCHDPVLQPRTSGTAGFAAAACAPAGRGWATDQDADPNAPADLTRHPNGEIEFYTGAPTDSTHTFAAGQRVSGSTTTVVAGIRVVTPPATVPYGLAGTFGETHGVRQSWATAQLLTVLPARDWNPRTGQGGNLQLYATAADVAPTPTRRVGWCARSGPRESWDTGSGESNHPTGVCDVAASPLLYPSVPHGYLTADSSAHKVIVQGGTVQLAPQVWPAVARVRDLRAGLLGSGGRLVQSGCRGGNGEQSGGYPGVEAAHLADFVQMSVGSADALRTFVLSGAAAATPDHWGWLSPDILRCGRLAVLPVLDPVQTPPNRYGLTTTTYSVASLRLVWIDNTFAGNESAAAAIATAAGGCLQRGLYWENVNNVGWCPNRNETDAPLRAITGYVLDPRLLPTLVSGQAAANTAPYLASGLPAAVRLVRDQSDPPAT